MDIKQVYQFTNDAVKQVLGKSDLLKEDLTNIVDVGNEVRNNKSLDAFVHSLVDHIGKVVFVDRLYTSQAPSVLRDNWEYGSILEKIDSSLPEASEAEMWELQDGASYDSNIFYGSKVTAKFFNKRLTFEIDKSIPTSQAKSAFSSAEQMGSFIARIFTKVKNAYTIRLDKLIMSTICNAVASTYQADIGANDATKTTGVKAVNLLKLYNDATGETLTKDKALINAEFLKFAALKMEEYSDNREKYSTLFNVGATDKFTPKADQKRVLLSAFKRACNTYLKYAMEDSNFTALPSGDVVSYWQGSGKSFDLKDTAHVNVKDADGNDVDIACLIGCIFDKNALGVCCQKEETTSNFVAKGNFTNYFWFYTAGFFNDLNENMVIFFLA